MLRVVAECTSHATTARLDRLGLESRDATEHGEGGIASTEGLLVTMPVNECAGATVFCGMSSGERQRAPRRPFLVEELLEHACLSGDCGGTRASIWRSQVMLS